MPLAPPAGALIQSLRSIGYNFNSAVADIVDNSIDAKAKVIDLQITPGGLENFSVTIKDDGAGMDFVVLKEAMSLGSKSPEFERMEGDLGRFGMGLKTASFSQAKILSVISKESGANWVGLRWDLTRVAESNQWNALVLDSDDISAILASTNDAMALEHGTIVRWDSCDRLVPDGSDEQVLSKIYTDTVLGLIDHLSLIFHKFFVGRSALKMSVNGKSVQPADPFCVARGNDSVGSTLSFSETVSGSLTGGKVEGIQVNVNGYLIPHPSRFKSVEALNRVAPHGDFISTQGVYVYRGNRLLSWGDWYRIVPRNQANRLARVEIEIPNTLDLIWGLDIKKSRIELPPLFRNWLKPKILALTTQSQGNHTGRTKNVKLEKNPVWVRVFDRQNEAVSYEISKSHALVQTIFQKLKKESEREFKALLELVECSLPIDQISNDIGARVTLGFTSQNEELPVQVKDLLTSLIHAGISSEIIFNNLVSDPTFAQLNQKMVKAFIDQLRE